MNSIIDLITILILSDLQFVLFIEHFMDRSWKAKPNISQGYQKQTTQIKKQQLKQKEFERDDDDLKYHDQKIYYDEKLDTVFQKEMGERLHKFQVAINSPIPIGKGDDIRGSGILISKDLVLTCAHNFYYRGLLVVKDKVKIYVAPFGELVNPLYVEDIYIPEGYRAVNGAIYDYALVKLKEQPKEQLKEQTKLEDFIPLSCEFLQKIRTQLIGIYGYPESSYTKIKYELNQQILQKGLMRKERIQQIVKENRLVHHKISTEKGQSGSPIILIEKTQMKETELHIVGVHKGSATSQKKKTDCNVGRLLTYQMIVELKQEAARMKAQPFRWAYKAYLSRFMNRQQMIRVRPEDMDMPLHQNIAFVNGNFEGYGCIKGSGCFISKNLLLTAAHLFFFQSHRLPNDSIQIHTNSCEKCVIEQVYIPKQYESNKNITLYDYALVKITEKIQSNDFIPLGFVSQNKQPTIAIFGYTEKSYPSFESQQKKKKTLIQWGNIRQNAIIKISNKKGEIMYNMPTEVGQAGSPIIQVSGKDLKLIGIHKGNKQYKRDKFCKFGRLITQDMLSDLEKEARSMGGEMFRVDSQLDQIRSIDYQQSKLNSINPLQKFA